MKNNLDFYPHYANSDQHGKFKMLRLKYGWAGEGRFWALNNRIAQSENCVLNLEKSYNFATIASDLDLAGDEFRQFLTYLETECNLITKTADGYTSDIIQIVYGKVSKERVSARERKARGQRKQAEKADSSGEPSKRVKESKVKESKGKNLMDPECPPSTDFDPVSCFKEFRTLYPSAGRFGTNGAQDIFTDQIKSVDDFESLKIAVENYKAHLSKGDNSKFTMHMSRFMDNWVDWFEFKPEKSFTDLTPEEVVTLVGDIA